MLSFSRPSFVTVACRNPRAVKNIPKPVFFRRFDLSLGRLLGTCDDLHQRRFSSAIFSHQRNLVILIDDERNIIKKCSVRKGYREAVYRNHKWGVNFVQK